MLAPQSRPLLDRPRSPAFQVLDLGHPPAPGDDPGNLVISVVDLLMLGAGGNEGEIAGRQVLALLPSLGHQGAVAGEGVNDGVLVAVVVNGGGGMGLGNHDCLGGERGDPVGLG